MDINDAFLTGDLKEQIYMEILPELGSSKYIPESLVQLLSMVSQLLSLVMRSSASKFDYCFSLCELIQLGQSEQ